MRKTRKHLISLAGKPCGGGHYLYRKGHVYPTLHISEDGTITSADVNLTLTRKMTVAEAYQVLGIKDPQ